MLLKDVIHSEELNALTTAVRKPVVASELQLVDVDQEHVHKTEDQNRFLKWMSMREDADGEMIYRAEVRFIRDHPYFFEHDRQHLPGLYIIEAGRQLGLAVPHLFLGVGYDYHSVLDGCDMSFSGFATLIDPLFIDAKILNPVFRKGALQSLSFDGTFIQKEKPIVRYQSHVRLIHERLLKRLEKQNQ